MTGHPPRPLTPDEPAGVLFAIVVWLVVWVTILALALAATSAPAQAGEIPLSWDPVAGAAGYEVGIGSSSGVYTRIDTVGDVTEATIDGLEDCTTHYLAVRAYDGAGAYSEAWSTEVIGWPRIRFDSLSPSSLELAAPPTPATILGANFKPGAAANLPDPASFTGETALDCYTLAGVIDLETLGPGAYTLEILNPDGTVRLAAGALTVGPVAYFLPPVGNVRRLDQVMP